VKSFSFSKKIALRYLWSKRSEAFITILTVISVLGIALGVTVITMVMAIMTGFQYELREKIVGADSHIIVNRWVGAINDWPTVKNVIAGIKDVDSVSAYTLSQVLIRANNRSNGILVRGIEENSDAAKQLAKVLEYSQNISDALSPKPVNITDERGKQKVIELPGIVVGRELAKTLSLMLGNTVSLFSPTVSSTPFGLIPRYKRFVVSATYSSGLREYESGLAYMPLAVAQDFFRLGDTVTGFEVRVKNIEKSHLVAKAIVDALSEVDGGGFDAQDWRERNRSLLEAMQLEERVYFWVLLLLIMLGSFSIVSTLVMIVLEKRRDIAILRTLGASSKSIARIFLIQGSVIGIIGTFSGLLGGYLGSILLAKYGFRLPDAFPFETVPIRLEFLNFLSVGVASLIICFLATIYPAYRASRLHPTEVLRYE
jgi:lipoprotein-releasing system permease protein